MTLFATRVAIIASLPLVLFGCVIMGTVSALKASWPVLKEWWAGK